MTQSCRAFRAFEFAAMPNGSRKRISGSGRVSRQDRQRRRVLIGRTRGTTGADWPTTERAVQRRASGRPKQSVTCDCLIYCVLYAVLCCVVKCPGKRKLPVVSRTSAVQPAQTSQIVTRRIGEYRYHRVFCTVFRLRSILSVLP